MATLSYPKAGFGVGRRYTATGYFKSVYNVGTPGTVYWRAGAVNAEGQTTEATLGNGVGATRSYDAATGLVRSIQSGVGESSAVQDLGYRFDSLGNLTTREDFNQDVYESFTYDRLNRLTGGIVYDADDDTERESKTYRYDAVGNIVNKSDVGAADYVYGTGNAAGAGDAGPHAVVSAGGNSYAYDDNGNMISGDGRTLTWTSFNKPETVVNGTTNTRFDYGPERARIRQVKVQGATTTTIKYVGTLFEQVAKTGAATEYVHYVFAGERRVAVYAKDNAPTPSEAVQYLHQDHLGSVDTITDESGGVVERLSYDAWGKRRTASGEDAWKDSAIAITAATTPRGFTDHEHLDDFELVHMNGRVYEPVLGRFLSPDPFVQYPESTQGFNRYTYAANNPLSFTDPNGYWLENLDEDDEIYDDDDWNAYDWGDDLSTDDEGGIGGLDDWGQSTQVSNPATGGRVPTSSGSPQGVNQAGVGGPVRHDNIFEYLAQLLFGGEDLRPQRTPGDYRITDEERALARAGDRRGFWGSRSRRGDPIAPLALDIADNKGWKAKVANALVVVHAWIGGVEVDRQRLGFDFMQEHIGATDADTSGIPGLLSAETITEYHHPALERHGLPPTAFGGTPFTGTIEEVRFWDSVWCGGCDSVR